MLGLFIRLIIRLCKMFNSFSNIRAINGSIVGHGNVSGNGNVVRQRFGNISNNFAYGVCSVAGNNSMAIYTSGGRTFVNGVEYFGDTERWTKKVTWDGICETVPSHLTLKGFDRVIISSGGSSYEVSLTVSYDEKLDEEKVKSMISLDGSTIEMPRSRDVGGGVLMIKLPNDSETLTHLTIQDIAVEVKIKDSVTTNAALRVDCASASCEIEAASFSKIQMSITSGDVTLLHTRVKGRIDIRSTSGDVELVGVETTDNTALNISSTSGGVEVDGMSCPFDVRVTSGNIKMDHMTGRGGSVATTSGDVHLTHHDAKKTTVDIVSGDLSGSGRGRVKCSTQCGDNRYARRKH